MKKELSAADEKAIADLIDRDEKIAAIKLYREKTGAGLADAKAAVENFPPPAHPEIGVEPVRAPADLTPIIHQLQRHGTIGAVKAYREQTGCGLRDAKLAVDEIARKQGITPRRGGCLGILILFLLLLAGFWFARF